MPMHSQRLDDFTTVLEAPKVDENMLKRLALHGCPHERGIRAAAWRYLLHYLPHESDRVAEEVKQKRETYSGFVQNFVKAVAEEVSAHPLDPNPTGDWSTFFKDNEILLQIDKDCRRLCPDLAFFQSATEYPLVRCEGNALRNRLQQSVLAAESISRDRMGTTAVKARRAGNHVDDDLMEGEEAHWEVCERILFVFYKLNPGQSYTQGMNELLGPIYYTFATDPRPEWRCAAEADTFYCFTVLMGSVRDNFQRVLDDSSFGVRQQLKDFNNRLRNVDEGVWDVFQKQNLMPEYFAFRWFTVLLSQEFSLPDVQRLWDSFFADRNLVLEVCVAMVTLQRDAIRSNDFASNMSLLQNYPPTDVAVILRTAIGLCST